MLEQLNLYFKAQLKFCNNGTSQTFGIKFAHQNEEKKGKKKEEKSLPSCPVHKMKLLYWVADG